MSKFKNIAVLIDAENASASKIDFILNQIMELGEIGIKQVYGDFKQVNLTIWDNLSLKYLFKQIHTPSLVKGKNSSDIALVIDAMDLLFHGNQRGEFDCFCLISSDSDFSGLAKYIRHKNKAVIGFGKSSAVDSFKMSCDQFFVIDNKGKDDTKNVKYKHAQNKIVTSVVNQALLQDEALINAIQSCVRKGVNDEGWAFYSQVNNDLKNNYPQFKPEQYGYNKWRELIQEIDLFTVKLDKLVVYVAETEVVRSQLGQKQQGKIVLSLNEEKLSDDISQIIVENPFYSDEWVHIGYLGSQLKHRGYEPKNYGFKTFTAFLDGLSHMILKQEKDGGLYFTLKDQSKMAVLLEQRANNPTVIIQDEPQTDIVDDKSQETNLETQSNVVDESSIVVNKTEKRIFTQQQLSFDDIFSLDEHHIEKTSNGENEIVETQPVKTKTVKTKSTKAKAVVESDIAIKDDVDLTIQQIEHEIVESKPAKTKTAKTKSTKAKSIVESDIAVKDDMDLTTQQVEHEIVDIQPAKTKTIKVKSTKTKQAVENNVDVNLMENTSMVLEAEVEKSVLSEIPEDTTVHQPNKSIEQSHQSEKDVLNDVIALFQQAHQQNETWLKASYLTFHLSRKGHKAKDYACKNMNDVLSTLQQLQYKEEEGVLWVALISE